MPLRRSRSGKLETRLSDSTARAGDLERQLTTTRDELDTTHAAQARLEARLASATQRAEEANARTDRADNARADADRERAAAEQAATRLETQLEQARGRIEELGADRDRLTTSLTESHPGARRDARAADQRAQHRHGGAQHRKSARPTISQAADYLIIRRK